jgi:hypothetical protein
MKSIWIAAAVFVIGLSAARVEAQGFGVNVGVSADPDQFYFGAGYETAELIERLRFRPNVEVGIGDEATLITMNFEFAYRIPIQRKPWSVYVGGGPALVISSSHGDHGDTDAGGGFNILLGLAHRRGLFTEIKVGVIDSPGFKFGVGYRFKA